MNKVTLVGNLGKDPELRGGGKVCVFSMATRETRKEKDSDKWENYSEWHNIVVLGRSAESAAKYLKKGSKVAISGRLQTRSYEAKDGSTRYTTEILADLTGGVEFLDSKTDSSERDKYAQKHGLQQDEIKLPDDSGISFDDDDIPF